MSQKCAIHSLPIEVLDQVLHFLSQGSNSSVFSAGAVERPFESFPGHVAVRPGLQQFDLPHTLLSKAVTETPSLDDDGEEQLIPDAPEQRQEDGGSRSLHEPRRVAATRLHRSGR